MSAPWAALVVPAELDVPTVEICCEFLTRLNELCLRRAPWLPALYESGARYELQPEFWLTIPWAVAAVRAGRGLDCKVLCAWRAAELRVRARELGARCIVSPHDKGGQTVFHVRLQRADGSVEDPSVILGMYQALAASGGEARPWNLLPSPY